MTIDPAQPISPVEAGSRDEHLGAVDWLRISAITAIAYYHTFVLWYPDSIVGPYLFAGLHALTAASVFFAARSRSGRSDREIVTKRFSRLLVPWLAFGTLFTAVAIYAGKFRVEMLWTGGSLHLWFLPFIFVASCAIAIARRHGRLERSTTHSIFWTALAIVALVIEPRLSPKVEGWKAPTWQVVNVLPAVCIGLAIHARPLAAGVAAAFVQLLLFAGAGVAACFLQPADSQIWAGAAATGGVVFGLCQLLPIRPTPASAFFARTSFGVYLVHIGALTVVIRVAARLAHRALNARAAVASDPAGLTILAQVAIALALSIAGVALLARGPLRRFVG